MFPLAEFYAEFGEQREAAPENLTLAFKIFVGRSVVPSAWVDVAGYRPLADADRLAPPFWKFDIVAERFEIYQPGIGDRRVEPKECLGLERMMVWGQPHVLERMRDLRAGRENVWAAMGRQLVAQWL